ncbi:hypothetical protein ACFZBC_09075 [Streptomyces luteogriseus]|uniref:hypothetical protein n=1 Tax=Streptomyces luteogriseus TaxID=68233 RepID=UPI0036F0FBA1
MNKYRIEAPVRAFTGESVGVHFAKGTGFVDDSTKEGRAAVEYFRRHGYGVFPADQETEETTEVASPVDAMTNLGHGSAPSVGYGFGVQSGPTPTGGGETFDPSKHNQDDVIAYLDSLVNKDSDSDAEFDRIIAAERDGKKRKAILARGEQKQEDQK